MTPEHVFAPHPLSESLGRSASQLAALDNTGEFQPLPEYVVFELRGLALFLLAAADAARDLEYEGLRLKARNVPWWRRALRLSILCRRLRHV